jgi:spermidine/putrescine transport system substrate-binding protein
MRVLSAAVAVMLVAGAAQAAELRVLNWQGYGTDEPWAVEAFEQRHGAEVVHDYFNSEQEMLTKLRTNPGYYDVVLINASFLPQAAAEGLVQAIDRAKIQHFGDLVPTLRDSPFLNPDGRLTAVAWVWGITSFAVDERKFPTLPDSIQALWDPQHKGRVVWRDDAVEAVQLAAIATGQDMNAPSDLEAIEAKLLALKPQIRTFWSSEDQWNKLFQAGEFDLATYWSGSAARSKKAFGLPVAFVIPKEGAIGWFDGLAVAEAAPSPELAHAFIDYMVSPEFYVRWDTEAGAPVSANAAAVAQLPPDAINRTQFGGPGLLDRLSLMAPIDDARRQDYLLLWQEVKTELAR